MNEDKKEEVQEKAKGNGGVIFIGIFVAFFILLGLLEVKDSKTYKDEEAVIETEEGVYLGTHTYTEKGFKYSSKHYEAYFKGASGNYYIVKLNDKEYNHFISLEGLEALEKQTILTTKTKGKGHKYLLIDLTYYPLEIVADSSVEIPKKTEEKGVLSEAFVKYTGTTYENKTYRADKPAKIVLEVQDSTEKVNVQLYGFELYDTENRTDKDIQKTGHWKVELYGGKYIKIGNKWYEYYLTR